MGELRRATPADARGIAAVQVATWRAAYAGILPERMLAALDVDASERSWSSVIAGTHPTRSGEVLVATADGDVVGFVAVGPTRDDDLDPATVGEVYAIYVLPERWDGGSGRDLMIAGLDALSGAGKQDAMLWVLRDNARGRRFYERGGWLPDGARKLLADTGAVEVRYRRPTNHPADV